MPQLNEKLSSVDPVWQTLRSEAEAVVAHEPDMAPFIYSTVLNHNSLEEAIIWRIAERLDHPSMPGSLIRKAFFEALDDEPELAKIIRVDLGAVFDRDAACERFIEPVLYFKGFHAIQTHRLANWLLRKGRRDFALYLQSKSSAIFQTDINPAVTIGQGFFLDHATGLVVGETARIGDDVSILQNVTLGGTGKKGGDRHPKIENGVLVGAGANILGNFTIGRCSRVAAGSVVLSEVPPNTTVAGVPAKVVGSAGCKEPSRSMDQILAEKGV
ncbi:MAG: serine O-acetyltransferase [Hyphomicrobiales bacterium]|nr:MAG: serine O-acetyltransferase [Hyphomicrobiales bacterium]